jgi:hypothetical protein
MSIHCEDIHILYFVFFPPTQRVHDTGEFYSMRPRGEAADFFLLYSVNDVNGFDSVASVAVLYCKYLGEFEAKLVKFFGRQSDLGGKNNLMRQCSFKTAVNLYTSLEEYPWKL